MVVGRGFSVKNLTSKLWNFSPQRKEKSVKYKKRTDSNTGQKDINSWHNACLYRVLLHTLI
jgi:hypothetical protein